MALAEVGRYDRNLANILVARLESDVQDIVAQEKYKPELGTTVRELEVDIRDASSSSTPLLRSLLTIVPNITDLALALPHKTPPGIFKDVHFPQLDFFCCNLLLLQPFDVVSSYLPVQ